MIDGDDVQYEVQVTNAYKNYGEKNVFNGLNMKVTSGSIYGLLGPSGCGKSTLLQCILETMELDTGTIDLRTGSLKDVGYMPQDLCLEEALTIDETFEYYGTLYKMTKKLIEIRKYELHTFLQLPDSDRLIKELSGGQSRRVSLAISLLHDPKLIILDEPTVGIDPLLRQEIWAEFTKMVVQHRKTIIITTHYIEEASQADCIGLMRNGVIVEEGTPQDILIKYNADTLESAFLTLCYDQDKRQTNQNAAPAKDKIQTKKLIEFEDNYDFTRIKALIKKNSLICSRDYLLLFTVLLLPILQAFNFCFSIGVNFRNMPIAIKNDEIGYKNCRNYHTNGCISDDNGNLSMSCVVMEYFASRGYDLIEVNDREAGETAMHDPKSMAFIHFPKNYTRVLTTYIDDRDNFDIGAATYVHMTKENLLFRNQIMMDIFNSLNHLIDTTLTGCNKDPRSINIPIDFHSVYGHNVKTYAHGVIALFIAMSAFYFPSVFAVSVMCSEKMDGVLSRSMFAGVKLMELLTSMFCICTAIIVVEMCFMCFITYVLFDNPLDLTAGLSVYAFVLLLAGWMGFFFGILTAVLSTTKLGSVYIITGLSLSQFLMSGAVWPLEGQPEFLRKVSRLIPMRLVGNTLNNLALKGWTFTHSSTVTGISIMCAYTVLLIIVLAVLGKFKKNWWVIQK